MIRVLVVDDSPAVARIVRKMLDESGAALVAGEGRTAGEALRVLQSGSVDVVLLDVQFTDMNAVELLKLVRTRHPRVPVLLLAALTQRGAQATVDALSLGAVDFFDKSKLQAVDHAAPARELIDKLRAATNVRRSGLHEPVPEPKEQTDLSRIGLCAIGASTGGPAAIQAIVQGMREPPPFPILVALHMPSAFVEALARRLDEATRTVRVSEAKHLERLMPGRVYIAPANAQLRIARGLVTEMVTDDQARRPGSIDLVFESVAAATPRRVLGILLTGLGRDGVRGLAAIRQARGVTIAQDEHSSAVFGMPRAAIEAGAAEHVMSLPLITKLLGNVKPGSTIETAADPSAQDSKPGARRESPVPDAAAPWAPAGRFERKTRDEGPLLQPVAPSQQLERRTRDEGAFQDGGVGTGLQQRLDRRTRDESTPFDNVPGTGETARMERSTRDESAVMGERTSRLGAAALPPATFSQLLDEAARPLLRGEAKKVLVDARNLNRFRPEDDSYWTSYWLPRALERGLTRLAVVLPDNEETWTSCELVLSREGERLTGVVRLFETLGRAHGWLARFEGR